MDQKKSVVWHTDSDLFKHKGDGLAVHRTQAHGRTRRFRSSDHRTGMEDWLCYFFVLLQSVYLNTFQKACDDKWESIMAEKGYGEIIIFRERQSFSTLPGWRHRRWPVWFTSLYMYVLYLVS